MLKGKYDDYFPSIVHAAGGVIQARGAVGHTRISTTADIYQHVTKPMQRDAAEKLGKLFEGLTG